MGNTTPIEMLLFVVIGVILHTRMIVKGLKKTYSLWRDGTHYFYWGSSLLKTFALICAFVFHSKLTSVMFLFMGFWYFYKATKQDDEDDLYENGIISFEMFIISLSWFWIILC